MKQPPTDYTNDLLGRDDRRQGQSQPKTTMIWRLDDKHSHSTRDLFLCQASWPSLYTSRDRVEKCACSKTKSSKYSGLFKTLDIEIKQPPTEANNDLTGREDQQQGQLEHKILVLCVLLSKHGLWTTQKCDKQRRRWRVPRCTALDRANTQVYIVDECLRSVIILATQLICECGSASCYKPRKYAAGVMSFGLSGTLWVSLYFVLRLIQKRTQVKLSHRRHK